MSEGEVLDLAREHRECYDALGGGRGRAAIRDDEDILRREALEATRRHRRRARIATAAQDALATVLGQLHEDVAEVAQVLGAEGRTIDAVLVAARRLVDGAPGECLSDRSPYLSWVPPRCACGHERVVRAECIHCEGGDSPEEASAEPV